MKQSRPKRTWRGRRGRRAGESQPQAWTKKARDDIYARRQAGEHWETIYPVWRRFATLNCVLSADLKKDYPDRTRAAMQQQYSVSSF